MDFEKLGSFYLGKEFDVAQGKLLDRLVMYDARDLTTHAVCVGMTGSGKTGLCIDLLEEAAIDRVPALIIDPKGDMTNLLLNFPELRGRDFRPWVNPDDARRKGLSEDEFADQQAELWKKGLADWGQDPARMRMLSESAETTVYTPGSDAGQPVSILHSFAAPPPQSWDDGAELVRERIQGIVSGLLGLIGVDADPVKSREHILLANLFEDAWRRGVDLDIASLIVSIQNPPIRKLGVFDIDTFFPPKERFELAMSLNNIVASPTFQNWTQGHPLDIGGFLATPTGKPRHSIFYIAHLSDAERMFFVTMLLNQVIAWMRTQSGTTSLRAIVYMDEILGFFPPVANPPSKRPMLTLLKQARAFGLGVVLATQNPIDLDYKGLTNAGTWFVGRLQTDRDKARVLDGLEGASSEGGGRLDRSDVARIISDLGNRTFLLHNVHEDHPAIFQTRWALSYLRGPMTRSQIRELKSSAPPPVDSSAPAPVPTARGLADSPPALPPGLNCFFIEPRKGSEQALAELAKRSMGIADPSRTSMAYRIGLLGRGRVHFVDRRLKIDEFEEFSLLIDPPDKSAPLRWEDARELALSSRDLSDRPQPEWVFEEIPENVNETRELKELERGLEDHLYRSRSLTVLHNPALDAYSQPRESRRDFTMRLIQEMREQRDAEIDKLKADYRKRFEKLEEKLRRAEQTADQKQQAASARKTETLVSVGETILGVFFGRRSTRSVSSGLSKYRMSASASSSARAAEENVEAIRQEIESLQGDLTRETDAIGQRWEKASAELEEKTVAPRRTDVSVEMFGLAWTPHWRFEWDDSRRVEMVPAI